MAPKLEVIKRSDAFQGLRSLDKSNYSGDLRVSVENVEALNLTGNAGRAVNQMALEFDHRLELEQVKRDAAETLADERLKMVEQMMAVLDRVAPPPDGESNGRQVSIRPTREAAE